MRLDRAALVGLGAGLGLYVMPLWREGRLRWAFWLTAIATAVHIYASRRKSRRESRGGSDG